MNFLGLGPGELLLIAALGLIIFGPGKLPEIAGQVGRAVRDFRRSTTEISSEFQRSFSLENPPPTPAPAGPAAPFAANGAANASRSDESRPTATSEPPLADTSEWHWESTDSEQQASTVQSEHRSVAETSTSSFWQWDSPADDSNRAVHEVDHSAT